MTAQVARLARVLTLAAWGAGVVVCLLGSSVLVTWLLAARLPTVWLEALPIRQLNSGLGLSCAGAGLLALLAGARRTAQALGGVAAIIGAVVLGEYGFGVDLGPPLAPGSGRMEPETAICLVLVGLAIGAATLRKSHWAEIGVGACALTLVIALLVAFGQVYSVHFSFGITAYTTMSLGAALAFIAISLGILVAQPERGLMALLTSDGAGGVMARRLYPAATIIPLGLGWMTLVGERMRLFNGKFGLSLFVMTSIVLFLVLISLTYRALDRTDRARMRLAAVLLEEKERRHIARELHDEIGQSLTALKYQLEPADPARLEAGIARARDLVRDLQNRVSDLSLDLRPPMLDDLGLLPALLWLVDRYTEQTGIAVELAHQNIDRRFSSEVETAAYRIIQEALNNAAKYAAVKRLAVRVWAGERVLGLQVVDEGAGFDEAAARRAARGTGLSGMRERALALGGEFTLESSPGRGVRLGAELPIAAPKESG